ncbi:uncharacterized protein [Arachis hypogaea]|uniref:uncharacterized protein isoform X5 n=1 Tax=Arachis hypogaea TaxID=3818 RepID=UPI003B21FBEE
MIDEELLQEVVNMGFDRNQLLESLCNRIQNEMGLVMICLKSYGGCAGPLMDVPCVQDRVSISLRVILNCCQNLQNKI